METLPLESIIKIMEDRNLRAVAQRAGIKYAYLRKILIGAEVTTIRHQKAIERLSDYLRGGNDANVA